MVHFLITLVIKIIVTHFRNTKQGFNTSNSRFQDRYKVSGFSCTVWKLGNKPIISASKGDESSRTSENVADVIFEMVAPNAQLERPGELELPSCAELPGHRLAPSSYPVNWSYQPSRVWNMSRL